MPAVTPTPSATPSVAVPSPPQTFLTPAEIEARKKEAEEAKDLGDELRKKIVELYRQAGQNVQQAEQLSTQALKLKSAAEAINQRVADVKREMEELKNREARSAWDQPLAALEQELSARDLQLKELKNSQTRLEAEPVARANRRKEIRALLIAAPAKLDDLKKQLEMPAGADEPAALTAARRCELQARLTLQQRQLPALQNELAKYEAEDAADVVRLERDLLAQRIQLAQKEFDLLNDRVRQKRDLEAQRAVARAQEEAISAQPVLKPYAEENQKLALEAKAVTEQIERAERALALARRRLEEVQRQFTQTRQKVDNVGLTGAIGLMLRKQRSELADIKTTVQSIGNRRQLIDDTQFTYFEYDGQRSQLSNVDPEVGRILAQADPALSTWQRDRLQEAARSLLERKREYLDPLNRGYNTLFYTLVDLDTTERQLVKVTRDYQNYIDERVLWIRSARPFFADMRLEEAEVQLFQAWRWHSLARALFNDARTNMILYGCSLLVFLALLHASLRIRREIRSISEVVSRGTCAQYLPTLRTALLTAVLAIPVPCVLFFLAWRIALLAAGEELARGLSGGLWAAGCALLFVEWVRQICRPKGLAEAHFDWPNTVTGDVWRQMKFLRRSALGLLLVVMTLSAAHPDHGQHMLERAAMLVGVVLVAVVFWRMFAPQSAMVRLYASKHPRGWLTRLRQVWCWGIIITPLAIGGLSFFGYHYTAYALTFRLFVTAVLFVVVVVTHALLHRLILVVRRKISISENRQRRLEATVAVPESPESALDPLKMVNPDEERRDWSAHTAQFQRLVTTALAAVLLLGAWGIWRDVVPALGFLDRYCLWTKTVTVVDDAGSVVADGQPTLTPHERIEPVTLADLGLTVLIAIVTLAAARNIPGLMEMSVLQRLPLDNSVRYAVSALASYAIVLVGVIVGCKTIGLQWSQIQWLATALTFGLAFGLQEMFANFVAGLIILFERPMRVGDVVTVDQTTGVVSRIRIRATTITNWDRKEFIVPNKEFITGKILNWTLSDQINRVVVNVGVAYGSNTELVHRLLLKAAEDHPLVLDDPPPLASFEGFGESTLDFVLRAFLPSLENRLKVIHELHTAVDKLFREADIEIAFPQRDLHVRSIGQPFSSLVESAVGPTGQPNSDAA